MFLGRIVRTCGGVKGRSSLFSSPFGGIHGTSCGTNPLIRACASSARPTLYDEIAFDYIAIKSNVFKRWVEEPTFWKSLGDVGGKSVLDLACGNGHYARTIKERGAVSVHGIDLSEHMVREARRMESENPLAVTYEVGDAASYAGPPVDIVTAQYLLPYAADYQQLLGMCKAAAGAVNESGRFVSVTTTSCDWSSAAPSDIPFVARSQRLGYALDWTGLLSDGALADITLFAEGQTSRVTLPNYLWTYSKIEQALLSAGFQSVEWIDSWQIGEGAPTWLHGGLEELERCPVKVFIASR